MSDEPISPPAAPSTGVAGLTVLVTGASEGIGRGLAISFAAAGANVLVASRGLAVLTEVRDECRDMGVRADAYQIDVSKVESIERVREQVVADYGRLDVLVNSAGFSKPMSAWDLGEGDWDRTVDVGLKGVFFCCQRFGAVMRAQGSGRIINLSSTLSISTIPGTAAYGAVKAAVSRLTANLAVEWAADGVRVNAIAPASTRTPSRERMASDADASAEILRRIPLGRLTQIGDIAPAALLLASREADYLTGQTIFVDGGWSAGLS